MNLANIVERRHLQIERNNARSEADEKVASEQILEQVLQRGYAWATGDIRLGDIILIIDSDTRVPADCLFDAAIAFHESPDVAILQHRSRALAARHSYWETWAKYFTEFIYTIITYGVVAGNIGPFLGYYLFLLHIVNFRHNAFIRRSALQKMSWFEDGQMKWWSEDKVSEDSDMCLRLEIAGWRVRYVTSSGDGFQEGVSLTIYDEFKRWQRYSYGCVCPILARLTTGGTHIPTSKKLVATGMLHPPFQLVHQIRCQKKCKIYIYGIDWNVLYVAHCYQLISSCHCKSMDRYSH